MTREEARAKFAEMVARNENDPEPDRTLLLIAAEEYPCRLGKLFRKLRLDA
jgi:hypothetical protein